MSKDRYLIETLKISTIAGHFNSSLLLSQHLDKVPISNFSVNQNRNHKFINTTSLNDQKTLNISIKQ